MKIELEDYYFRRSGKPSGAGKVLLLGNIKLYFSYSTIIAFQELGKSVVVSENVWGKTTAKHIKAIPTDNCTPHAKFLVLLNKALNKDLETIEFLKKLISNPKEESSAYAYKCGFADGLFLGKKENL